MRFVRLELKVVIQNDRDFVDVILLYTRRTLVQSNNTTGSSLAAR